MLNFAISMLILALCDGAQPSAQPAKGEAKADGAHCAMHASKKAGTAGDAKSCCAKHSADAKSKKAGMAPGECKHADGKAAAAKHADGKHADGASCCAKHEKPAAGAAAHTHAAAGASCKHDAKPATAAVTAEAKTDVNSVAAYVCPMHADITSSTPADCSKCGMKLEKKS